jgi:hypothetical protein
MNGLVMTVNFHETNNYSDGFVIGLLYDGH